MNNKEKPQTSCAMPLQPDSNSVLQIGSNYFDCQQFFESCANACFEKFGPMLQASIQGRGITIPFGVLNALQHEEGTQARIMQPGQSWVSGRLRVKVSLEFLPDLPEQVELDQSEDPSTLDDLRAEA